MLKRLTNNKVLGFTLIELLAVIVILAIIALIATPIVLNIINDTKESAIKQSADFYEDALELSISTAILKNKTIKDGVYNIIDGDMCLNEGCTEKLEVEVNGEVPKTGEVTITKGQIEDITLNLSEKTVTKNEKGQFVIGESKIEEPICKLVENGDVAPTGISAGDKYQCKVKDNMEEGFEDGYYFYVLSQEEDGTTNLIMDRNINSDGTPVAKAILKSDKDSNGGIYNLVAWNSSGSNADGPVTAMNFVYQATKDWENIPALNYTYNDKQYQGTIEDGISYTSFVSNNGIATITSLSGYVVTIGSETAPLRARMSIYSAIYDEEWNMIGEKGEVLAKKIDNSNAYLYDYLKLDNNIQNNPIDAIYGYWTLSSMGDYSNYVWYVASSGYVRGSLLTYDSRNVVRPVINLKLK